MQVTSTLKMPGPVAYLVEQMYRAMEGDPQYLLMEDGGPVGQTAHVVIARLYGQDEQLDHEWRTDKAEPVLLTPHMSRSSALLTADPMEMPRSHEYVLQSGFTRASLAAGMAGHNDVRRWIGKDHDPGTFQWTFLALRYRRRT